MARHGENIRKRKDGRWEGRYKVFDEMKQKDIYRSVYGSTYGEVRGKLSNVKRNLSCQVRDKKQVQKLADHPKHDDGIGITVLFSQAAAEWFEEIADKRKYSTYVKYHTVYKTHLAGIIGSCQLSADVTQELQEKIFDHLSEKGLSESMLKSIFCIANQILDFADRKYSAGVPPLEKPAVKPKRKNTITFSRAEQTRLFSVIYDELDRFKTALLLCLHTGIRLGEVCALQWTDIDMNGMTLTVNRTVQRVAVKDHRTKTILMETDPKSESSKRTIPLTTEILKLLLRLKGKQAYVFSGEKPLDPRTMQYRFKKILKQAEIDGRNFHILRHTFATNCVENGMDVKALSEILGHSDVKITLNRYVHSTMDSKRKQIRKLLDFYGQVCGRAA